MFKLLLSILSNLLNSIYRRNKFPLACEQALLFGRVKRVSRERSSERRSREGHVFKGSEASELPENQSDKNFLS